MTTRPLAFVGLSGGVDSSVAALRLKNAGYEVVGVFIRVWHPDFITCTEEADRKDAMRVAARLEIPFLNLDARDAYRDGVAGEMIREYERGRTPNPDVLCNKIVKFGVFEEFRKKYGAEILATGHYAQRSGEGEESRLSTSIDKAKDQTYFLWMIERTLLSHISFPIGMSEKSAIRKEAARAGFVTAAKRDSQGICFLGKLDIVDFLSHYITTEPGVVLNDYGENIGTHPGALFFTIGQRHGFTVAVHDNTATPLYVVAKDISANTLIVSKEKPFQATGSTYVLSDVNLLVPSLDETRTYDVVTRYHGPKTKTSIHAQNGEYRLSLLAPAEAVSLGQSAVFYDGDICIGGGIINAHE